MKRILAKSKQDLIIILEKLFFLMMLILTLNTSVYAQSIMPQKLDFTKICAQSSFNTFNANFKFSGFPALTTFEVELSDDKGSFIIPIATSTLSTLDISSSEKTISFAIPSNIIGSETYKLRVKSSTGITSGDFSAFDLKTSFPIYFKPFNGSFYINNQLPNVSICNSGSVKLTIDNPTPNIQNSSPANFLGLKYKWYKNNTVIAGESSSSRQINATGVYYVEIDYGSCSDVNFRSQDVTVNIVSGNSATITSSLGNSFCSNGGTTTLSTAVGNSYVWKKDNVVIPGATNSTYQTNSAGKYSVDIDFGGCKSTGSIDLQVNNITSSINVPLTSTIKEGDVKLVTVTTNAISPSIQWFLNDSPISGANSSSYSVSTNGDYKVIITQNSGCSISNEILFVINYPIVDTNVVAIPNLISPNGDGVNDTWIIPQEYVSGSNSEVTLISSTGEIVLNTRDYLNNWPENTIDFKNVNPVYYYIITTEDNKTKKGSITIVK